MISYEDILASLIDRVRQIKEGVTVTSNDISEGFKRPSFFIKIENIENDNFMNKFQERTLDIKILYFPKEMEKNQLELLKTIDEISKKFIENNYIQLENDFIVEIENQRFNQVDGVLHFDFEIYLSEEYEKEDKELIEDLIIGGGYGN